MTSPLGGVFCNFKSDLSNLQNGARDLLFLKYTIFDHFKQSESVKKHF